jgi:hypothetical protein
MFIFIYKGKYDCLISKKDFESYIKNLYFDIKKKLNVKFTPKKIIITMSMNENKQQGWGGTTNNEIYNIFRLELQLHGYPKKLQTFEILSRFFGDIVRHEIFHFFIPYIENNSCWSEGVTDFMTYWYNDTIKIKLKEHLDEYNSINDKKYKEHKYGYISGFTKMAKLFYKNNLIIDDMKKIIQDFNKNDNNRQKSYTKDDIILYNNKFKTFFIGKCNIHKVYIL